MVSLFWCFVCLYPINVNVAKPIGTKLCVGPHMTPAGKVYECSKLQKFVLKSFDFCYVEMREKILFNSRTFLLLFVFYKRSKSLIN